MNLLDKNKFGRNFFTKGTELEDKNPRGLSLTLRKSKEEFSLKRSFLMSTLLHPFVLIIFWIITQITLLLFPVLGIQLPPLMKKPEPKVQDIDFVLKDHQQHNRPIIHHIKPKTLVVPKHQTKKFAPTQAAKAPKKKSLLSSILNNTPLFKKPGGGHKGGPAKQGGGKGNKPASETNIPLSKKQHKGSRIPHTKTPDAFSIPMPKIKPLGSDIGFGGKGTPGFSSGHISHHSKIGSGSGYSGDGTANVAGKGARHGRGTGSGSGNGYGSGSGNGNGSGSGGYGSLRRGRTSGKYNDLLGDANLSPYITELQRRIKRNWNPPKNNENKRVVLFLRISKNGSLLTLNVKNTSENAAADNAAIAAVRRAQPFRPLPSGYRENYVDAVFTFDYNINSVGGRY